jgi:septal ring factor EnvC (AmiA/AmiB activator)
MHMQSLSDDERKQVLGEVLHDELQAILELVKDVPAIRHDLTQVQSDISELKQDMKIVKAAVTDLSRQGQDHERRLTRLEARVP